LESIQRDVVLSQTWKQFTLNAALEDMVNPLVDTRHDPAVLLANFTDSGHFPSHEVAQTKANKKTLFMQPVYFAESILKWGLAIWGMEVEHVDFVSLERFRAGHQSLPDILRLVSVCVREMACQLIIPSVGIKLGINYETASLPC